jgi:hypothetical protein
MEGQKNLGGDIDTGLEKRLEELKLEPDKLKSLEQARSTLDTEATAFVPLPRD